MSEQFNVKYRPKSREKLIGYTDEELNEIGNNVQGATAVLFYGPTGSGKTTLAKLLANEITEKESIMEANAGADGGIDDVRKMIANAKRRTLSGKRRVYIIDEAHKLTKQAQDALLVPLESEDTSTLWMLCSNEPERLPPVMMRRLLKIATPEWTEARLLKLAKRVSKQTGKPVPADLKQFANPSDLLTHMQQPSKVVGDVQKRNVATATYLLNILLGNGHDRRKVNYDFKFSTVMEISLAIRGTLGAVLPYESPDPQMMKMIKSADPRVVARVSNACATALRDDTKPPMVLLDILVGSCAAPFHFEPTK